MNRETPKATPISAAQREPTVLVADDNAQNRDVVWGMLTSAGYGVDQVESGEKCLTTFNPGRHDLLLLDIMMPGMNGFETCRQIRSMPGGMDVPIVFLTAISDPEIYESSLDAGADDFLTKPIKRTELLLRVRSLIRIRHLQQELRNSYELLLSQRNALALLQFQKKWKPSRVAEAAHAPRWVASGR